MKERKDTVRFWGVIGDLGFIQGRVLSIMRNLEMTDYEKK